MQYLIKPLYSGFGWSLAQFFNALDLEEFLILQQNNLTAGVILIHFINDKFLIPHDVPDNTPIILMH